MSNVLYITKAEGVAGKETPPVVIKIDGRFPDFTSTSRWQAFEDQQAMSLHDALRRSLPGGVYDRLFAIMAEHKASDLIVSLDKCGGSK